MPTENPPRQPDATPPKRQPVFNLPPVVMSLILFMVMIELAKHFVLGDEGQTYLYLWFGFIPSRLWAPELFPGGSLPLIWTSLTHAFLHAGWEHLLLNMAWLAIFGTPVAHRYGAIPFLLLFALSAIAGALLFLALPSANATVLVGASGGISGLTGAAIRFIFQPVQVARNEETGEVIALGRSLATIGEVFKHPRPRYFLIFWLGANALVPLLVGFMPDLGGAIAWQAHIGGFIVGFFLVAAFDHREGKKRIA